MCNRWVVLTVGLVFVARSAAGQLRLFEKQKDPVCPIATEAAPAVRYFAFLALSEQQKMMPGPGQEFAITHLLAGVAEVEACLREYAAAAQHADAAYPAGSEAQVALGSIVARQEVLVQADELAKKMLHGAHSFYFGVVEELAKQEKFEEAKRYAMKVQAPEVRASAMALVITGMFKAHKDAEANALLEKQFAAATAEQKKRASMDDARLGILLAAERWDDVRMLITRTPMPLKEFELIALAANEADAGAQSAATDLKSAAAGFSEDTVGAA